MIMIIIIIKSSYNIQIYINVTVVVFYGERVSE
jgi:hypothetical protein